MILWFFFKKTERCLIYPVNRCNSLHNMLEKIIIINFFICFVICLMFCLSPLLNLDFLLFLCFFVCVFVCFCLFLFSMFFLCYFLYVVFYQSYVLSLPPFFIFICSVLCFFCLFFLFSFFLLFDVSARSDLSSVQKRKKDNNKQKRKINNKKIQKKTKRENKSATIKLSSCSTSRSMWVGYICSSAHDLNKCTSSISMWPFSGEFSDSSMAYSGHSKSPRLQPFSSAGWSTGTRSLLLNNVWLARRGLQLYPWLPKVGVFLKTWNGGGLGGLCLPRKNQGGSGVGDAPPRKVLSFFTKKLEKKYKHNI